MSPKVPKAYLEARRTEILGAAYKCFIEKGFHNTTMQDIYNATSLSPGAVYNYFSSKEDIVIAATKGFQDWSISSLTSLISENPNESLIKYVQFWLSLIKQSDVSKSISVQLDLYSEATRNSSIREAMLKTMDATHAIFIELIKHNQQAGVFNAKLDPLAIARVFVGMVFVVAVHKIVEPDVNVDTYEAVCEAMIKGTFACPPKRRRSTNRPKSKRRPAEKN